jgi:hypothetical protein
MDEAVDAFERLLSAEVPADIAPLQRQRLLLVRETATYLEAERSRLTSTDDGSALYATMLDLRMRYSGHITDWTGQRIAAEWPAYRAQAAGLIAAVRRLLAAGAAAGETGRKAA